MSDMARTVAWLATLAFFFCAFAMTANSQKSGSLEPGAAPPLRIGSGDLLDLTMFENPDLSGHFRVDEKGDIIVPLIGRVHVQGDTAEQAAKVIEERYVQAQILQPAESHATVFITEYASQGIIVSGAVKSPGVYPALGVRMLNDVVTAAGGVTDAAASKVIITHRNNPESPVTVEYNPEGNPPLIPNVQVFPGDTVMVPRAGMVYVVGNVLRSGGYVLNGRRALTVEEAMALAGGSGHAAALKRVQLVRTVEGGRKEMITIPLNLIYKGEAPDVALKDGDILYVPTSNGRLITEQAITSALGIGTQVAVYKSAY